MTERGGGRGSQRSYRSASSDPRNQPPLAKLKDCCRTTIAFVFSNVGVCVLMVGYNIAGAFLFAAIEGGVQKVYTIESRRNNTIEKLWNFTVEFNTLYPHNWTVSVTDEIQNYQSYIVKEVSEGWDGFNDTSSRDMWTKTGGFLYSLTVITTIGYGHISPRTDMGKVVTIFYTIFGMPVFLLYMANMGDILAKSLKYVYSKLCMCRKEENQYDTSVLWRSADVMLRGAATSSVYVVPDGFSAADGYGGGGGADDYGGGGQDLEIRAISTRGRVSNSSSSREKRGPSGFSPFGRRSAAPPSAKPQRPTASSSRDQDQMYMEGGEEASESPSWRSNRSEKFDFTTINIPITVSLIIMIILLYSGTRMFEAYERWDPLTSFYFCFISLTTIGFGDYVPGSTVEEVQPGSSGSGNGNNSFIYCSLYLMFGLALLSMCFNLMQEEVVHKVNTCVKSITMGRKNQSDDPQPPD